jgi:alpha-1,2-mannosyltransferase
MIADATLERVLPARTVALVGDLIRALLWGGVALIWLVFGQIYARLWRLTLVDLSNSDFTIFYFTARLIADGLPMYGASPARYGIHWVADHLGNLNPPHFQLIVQPLAWLTYQQAYAVWTAASLAALSASALLAVRALGGQITWRGLLIWGAVLMSAAPFTTVAVTSELTFLLLLPATLAWIEARKTRWAAAGAWLGLCISLKLFFLLFVPWLMLRRHWRALAACAAVVAGTTALGLVVYGPRVYLQWFESLGTVGWWWLPMNASWQGLVARTLEGSTAITPLVHAPALVKPLAVVGAALICAATVWRTRGSDSGTRQIDTAFLLILLGAILGSPLGWVYYLPLIVPPLAAVFTTGSWRVLPRPTLIVLLLAAAGLYVPLEQAAANQPSAVVTLTIASVYFWSSVALWTGALALAKRVAA